MSKCNVFKSVVLTFILCLFMSTKVDAIGSTGYIFIGDSRTVGMHNAVKDCDDIFFVAKDSKGYKWLCDEAVDDVKSIMSSHGYSNWVLISNLGVNDLGNIDKYEKKYKDLVSSDWKDCKLYLTSVTCIDKSKYRGSVTNSEIQKFNKQLGYYKNYIDIYELSVDILDTQDGLHYSNAMYQELFNNIMMQIK